MELKRAESWPTHAGTITAVLIGILYLMVGVFDHAIWAPVEPTIAGIVWNMVENGNLAIPFVNTDPFVEKPPFYYWLSWLITLVTGRFDAGTVRLPAALLGVFCLALVFRIADRTYGRRVACLTALIGALSLMFWDAAHRAASDISATFFVFLCFAIFARGLDDPAADRQDRWQPWDLAFCAALAASFYAKNVFTFLLVLPPVAVTMALDRQPRRLFRVLVTTGVLLVVLLLPWVVAVYREGGFEQLRIIFFDNTVGRFLTLGVEYSKLYTTSISDALLAEKEPFYFYLPRLFAYPLPFTPLVLVAVVDLFQTPFVRTRLDRFLLVGVITMPIALSLSSAKSTDYMVPILFFYLLVTARFLSLWIRGEVALAGWERFLIVANAVILLAVMAVFPIVIFAIFPEPSTLLLAPPAFLAAWLLYDRARREPIDDRWAFDLVAVGALAAAAGLAIAIPSVDREKSYEAYFTAVEPLTEDRALISTFHEISRMPLINFYLRRHAEVYDEKQELIDRLYTPEPLAAFIRCETYEERRETIDAIPGVLVIPEPERRHICFVANRVRS